ncbi:uncharacterized protein L201_005809 [Kwoniella dendrophila CBS 6074]|uniref:Uncharacterized protein n=1 Tax=Kwoniella dendrophila CBS 6074 TaxID=1295534 RepID=A0AAX4JZU8_9TREE
MPAPVMSQLENTSAILGEYMLKGWTLTDLHCGKCKVTPLMREPNAIAERENRDRIQFCALCDGRPEGRIGSSSRNIHNQTQPQLTTTTTQSHDPIQDEDEMKSITDDIEIPEKYLNDDDNDIKNESDEITESISELLLKGYSLLNENCPNSLCKGIPLIGYPKLKNKQTGLFEKSFKKLCVSCNSRFIDESQLQNQQSGMSIINNNNKPSSSTSTSTSKKHDNEDVTEAESPRTKARNQLYGLDPSGNNKSKGKGKAKVTIDPKEFENKAKESMKSLQEKQNGKGNSGNDIDNDMDVDVEDYENDPTKEAKLEKGNISKSSIFAKPLSFQPDNRPIPPSSESSLGKALTSTSESLSMTLQNLSSSLERYSSRGPTPKSRLGSQQQEEDNGRWFVDLKLHTEAIKDVLSVIDQVERAKRIGY